MGPESVTPSILVVDDYAANVRAFAAMLEGVGATILEAASGEQALAVAAETELALVLLDVGLPGIDGFTTARRLRASPRHGLTPIVFVTGRHDDPVLLASASGLAEGFVQKPVNVEGLRRLVRSVLARGQGSRAKRAASR